MTYDADKVKEEITEQDRKEMLEALQKSTEVPDFMKTSGSRLEEIWVAGCWLNEKLKEAGCAEKEVGDIGFVHGQRSFAGNPYKWAAALYNEFVESGTTKDRPGPELAEKISDDCMEVGEGFVALTIEDAK